MITSQTKKQIKLGIIVSVVMLLIGALSVTETREGLLSAIGLMGGDSPAVMDGEALVAGKFRIKVSVNPERPRVGRNKVNIQVMDENGAPVSGAKLRVVAEMAAMGSMPAMQEPAEISETAPGQYQGVLEIPMAGSWPLAVDVEKAGLGHGDLVFDMATGRKGLTSTVSTPKGVSHYTCSMHTSVKSATPGTCPICSMDLVPVTKEEISSGAITVSEGKRQTIGVKTQIIQSRPFVQELRAVGEVAVDTSRLTDVSLKFNGWIGELEANYIGQKIEKGQTLFTVYGPDLLSAQEEYLQTRRHTRNKALLTAARRRLALWDVRPDQIKALEKRGRAYEYLPLASPASGTLIEKNIVKGAGIIPGKTLLRIADLSRIWVEARIYEYELAVVSEGMPVTIELPDLPQMKFTGTVDWLDPTVDQRTRTGRIRVELDNEDGRLKPGMFANVRLKRDLGERLVVPEEAVLYAGDTRVVFVDLGEGRLAPKRIKIGRRNADWIVVIDGLKEGDKVVTSGNFLIAAESKLKSGLDQW